MEYEIFPKYEIGLLLRALEINSWAILVRCAREQYETIIHIDRAAASVHMNGSAHIAGKIGDNFAFDLYLLE